MLELPVRLPAVDEAVSRLEELLEDRHHVALRGAPGSGRSTLLRALFDRHAGQAGGRFLLVSAPHGDDAAVVALTQAAAQLDDSGQLTSLMKDAKSPWNAKLDAVLAALAKTSRSTTLLLDQSLTSEPATARSIFSRRAVELVSGLLDTRDLRYVVTTGAAWTPGACEVELRPSADAKALLEPGVWGDLAEAAQALAALIPEGLSPLDIRLRVLLVHAGEDPALAARLRASPHAVVARWLERLGTASQGVRALLGRLAVARTAFDRDLLEICGFGELPPAQQTAIQHALLFGEADELRLHETIAREAHAREWLTEPQRSDAHALVAAWHARRFEAARKELRPADAIRNELEEVHHLTEAGDAAALMSRSLWFVEQYDALGRSLSLRRRHAEAVEAYERALSHDPFDDYAHHYLAYNLDIEGREPSLVERSYREAIRLRPDHVWYESRWVSFLITRARVREAQAAWEGALATLFASGPSEDADVYRELHGDVARLLLHRGRLDFAQEVLEDVPRRVSERAAWYDALDRLGRLLAEAERDEVTFPPSIPLDERWASPHLADPSEVSGIRRWTPGRVTGSDETEVHVRIASGPESFAWRDLPIDAYRELAGLRRSEAPAAGTYVEFHELADGTERVRAHLITRFRDGALPKLWMNPDRYLRRAP